MGSKVASIAVVLFLLSALSSGQSPPPPAKCPDLKVCLNLLGGSLNVNVGPQQTGPCCSLVAGLAEVDAAVCLCTTIRANVLGLNVNVDRLLVQLLVNSCGRTLPKGFKCPTSPPTTPPTSPPTTPPTAPPKAPPTAPPNTPPTTPPMTPPTAPPKAPPTAPPTTPPTAPPKAPPTAPPNAPPTTPPKAPPTSPPIAPPTTPPTAPPKAPPTAPPTTPPTAPPKAPPTAPPNTPPTTPPKAPPTAPPTTPPTAPPKAPPTTPPKTPPTASPICPVQNLRICVGLLDFINIQIGSPQTTPCCSLISGFIDLEASVCICTALKANILGIFLDLNIPLQILLNNCGRKLPAGFTCRR